MENQLKNSFDHIPLTTASPSSPHQKRHSQGGGHLISLLRKALRFQPELVVRQYARKFNMSLWEICNIYSFWSQIPPTTDYGWVWCAMNNEWDAGVVRRTGACLVFCEYVSEGNDPGVVEETGGHHRQPACIAGQVCATTLLLRYLY